MAEQTITTEEVEDKGAPALPKESTEEVAVGKTTDTEPKGQQEEPVKPEAAQTTEGGVKPVPDDKLASFAKGQGIEDVSELSEREQKLLKVAYDNNAEFQRNRQKASQLEKNMTEMSDQSAEQVAGATGQDAEVLKRLQRMEVKDSIRDFWQSNPDARQYEQEMAEIATNAGLYGTPEAILKASYAIALSNNKDAVKSQGKQEALQNLAQKQQAAVPTGNATTSGPPKPKPFAEKSISEMEAELGFHNG